MVHNIIVNCKIDVFILRFPKRFSENFPSILVTTDQTTCHSKQGFKNALMLRSCSAKGHHCHTCWCFGDYMLLGIKSGLHVLNVLYYLSTKKLSIYIPIYMVYTNIFWTKEADYVSAWFFHSVTLAKRLDSSGPWSQNFLSWRHQVVSPKKNSCENWLQKLL